jgi:hypothetical protein
MPRHTTLIISLMMMLIDAFAFAITPRCFARATRGDARSADADTPLLIFHYCHC